jgi:hypothetical protein
MGTRDMDDARTVWPQSHARGRGAQQGFPPQAGQQAEQEVPDYLQLAGWQLLKISRGIDAMAKLKDPGDNPAAAENDPAVRAARFEAAAENDPAVRAARFELADRLIALAEIQYSIPDDGDPGDEEDL